MAYSRIIRFASLVAVAATFAGGAQAQQFKSYSFDQQNRGQLAVAMKQIEDSRTGVGVAGAGGTTIVCGGGAATAAANNTCIILNQANGVVTTDQLSDGDQSASASDEVSVSESVSGADEVLSTLTQ